MKYQLKKVGFLVRVSLTVKKHHNVIKENIIGPGLQFQWFSLLLTWWEARQYLGRHDVGEVVESSTF